ncbi:MAG: histidinol-phosphate transaminase [Nitrospiraceae bacterium]|nr:MAG: histidinol-phosphate transaminase [Nitrospiraceae bacterium]
MIHAPEHIKSISPYVPGKPVEELERELGISGSIKLASNENPLGPSPLAIRELRKGIRGLNRYPDGSCFYLKDALSAKLNIRPEEILFGNGSNELIELAVRTFMSPGDEAIMAHPSFVVYSMIVQAVNGRSIMAPLKDWRHDLDEMAARITPKTKIIFIANPNNPTGTVNTKAEMERLMNKVPEGVLVVVDEAYCEYVASPEYADSLKYFRNGRDILILRTFSKIYGLAGLRIGYGIANPSLTTEMNRVRQPFNVNSLAQKAASAALNDEKHIARSKRKNEAGKKYLYKELGKLGFTFVPTEANFIYVPLKDHGAFSLYNALLREGVIVRPMGQDAVRVTIGLPEENRKLIAALKTCKM